jgi:EAL domain-containing protein (putative c-di-GMP-specific phosphodiesterase class I)
LALTRNIDKDRARRAIVFAILAACRELDVRVIAEGIESAEECQALADEGLQLFQSYLLAKPAIEQLPQITDATWPQVEARPYVRPSQPMR